MNDPVEFEPGELRHRASIEGKPTTPAAVDTRGGSVAMWTARFSRWVKIEALSGRKLELARQLVPTCTHVVTLRYSPLVTVRDRVIYKGRKLYVGHLNDVEERRVRLELTCTERID